MIKKTLFESFFVIIKVLIKSPKSCETRSTGTRIAALLKILMQRGYENGENQYYK